MLPLWAKFQPRIRLLGFGRNAWLTGDVQSRCAVIQRTGGNSLVITPVAHAAATTTPMRTATTTTAAAESGALRTGFIHG